MSDDNPIEPEGGSESEDSVSVEEEAQQRVIKTDLNLLRNNKAVSSRLQIFNQLIEQRDRPAVQPRVFKPPTGANTKPRAPTQGTTATRVPASPARVAATPNSPTPSSNNVESGVQVGDIPPQEAPKETAEEPQPATPVKRTFVRKGTVDPTPAARVDVAPVEAQAAQPAKREFKKKQVAEQPAPAVPESAPADQASSDPAPRRQFKRKTEVSSPETPTVSASEPAEEAQVPRRVFKKKEVGSVEKRVFKKKVVALDTPAQPAEGEPVQKSPRKRVFKRGGPTLTGLEVGNASKWDNGTPADDKKEPEKPKDAAKVSLDKELEILDGQRRDFEAQKSFFMKNLEFEKEKLTQAKSILEEISVKLEDERKQLAEEKAAVHYEREELNILQREIKIQQTLQKDSTIAEEEREGYEAQIKSLKEELERKHSDHEESTNMLASSQKQIETLKQQWEKEKAELVNSLKTGTTQTANLEMERTKLAQERADLEVAISKNSSVAVDLQKRVVNAEKEVEQLKDALEEERKEKKKMKAEFQKAQESQITSLQENKDLLQQIAQKDKQFINVENNISNIISTIREQVDKFLVNEREEFRKEKQAWEDTQFKWNSVKETVVELSNDKAALEAEKMELIKERQKVNIIKRYIDDERKRFIEVKRKFEKEHDDFLKEKKEFLLNPPQIIINVEGSKASASATTKKPAKKASKKTTSKKVPKESSKGKLVVQAKEGQPATGKSVQTGPEGKKLGGEPADSDGDDLEDSKGPTDAGLAGSDSDSEDITGGMGYTFKGSEDQPGLADLKETLGGGGKGSRNKSRVLLETSVTTREDTASQLAALVEGGEGDEIPMITPRNVTKRAEPSSPSAPTSTPSTTSNATSATDNGNTEPQEVFYDDEGPYYGFDESGGDVFGLGDSDPVNVKPTELATKIDSQEISTIQVSESDPNEVVSGTLRALIFLMGSKDQNDEFSTAFLLTFDYFVRPTTLLKSIVMLYMSPSLPSIVEPTNSSLESRKQFQRARLIEIVNFWIILRYDILRLNHHWQTSFESFMKYLGTAGGVFAEHATTMLQTWQAIGNQYDVHNDRKRTLSIQTPMEFPTDSSSQQFLFISAQQMAQQLTLREQAFFQQIESTEYYAKGWESGETAAPNLTLIIERFNEMCYWVATEVIFAVDLNSQPSAEYRAQTISRFIHTMNELRALNNFNSLMQIYTGLHLPVVDHLSETWALVSKADREIMRKIGELMDHRNNYKNYRSALESIEEQPCIPFISLLLRDLTFIEEDNTFIPGTNGVINFEKMGLLSRIFERLQDWRGQLYDFEEEPGVQAYLNHKIVKSQDELEKIASVIEGGMDDGNAEGDQ